MAGRIPYWLVRLTVCVVVLVLGPTTEVSAADSLNQQTNTSASLDAQLLEGLQEDLGLEEDPVATGGAENTESKASATGNRRTSLDQELLDQFGQGEDVDPDGHDNPLVGIAGRMKTVQQRIDLADTSNATQKLQQQIVRDLAALIEQCKKSRCQQGSSAGQCDKPGTKAAQRASKKPARESTTRLTQRDSQAADRDAAQDLVKETWGQLPARLRQAMVNVGTDQFLPKYQQLIEDYFRRLAEDQRTQP